MGSPRTPGSPIEVSATPPTVLRGDLRDRRCRREPSGHGRGRPAHPRRRRDRGRCGGRRHVRLLRRRKRGDRTRRRRIRDLLRRRIPPRDRAWTSSARTRGWTRLARPRRCARSTCAFGPLPQSYAIGGSSVGVPGVVAGLAAVHGRWGRLGWQRVVTPAALLARVGVAMPAGLARTLRAVGPAMMPGIGAAIYAPEVVLLAGELLHHPDLDTTADDARRSRAGRVLHRARSAS